MCKSSVNDSNDRQAGDDLKALSAESTEDLRTAQISDSDTASSDSLHDQWLFMALLSLFVSFCFYFLYARFFIIISRRNHFPSWIEFANASFSLHFFLLAGVLFSYYISTKKREWGNALFLKNWRWFYIPEAVLLELMFFLPLGIVSYIAIKLLGFLKDNLGVYGDFINITPNFKMFLKMDWNIIILLAFMAVVIAPAVEEIIFRRVIYGFLNRKIGMVASLIVTSALFGAVHMSFADFTSLFLLAAIWQILYIHHKSLYPSIIYHTLHNSVAMIIIFVLKFQNG